MRWLAASVAILLCGCAGSEGTARSAGDVGTNAGPSDDWHSEPFQPPPPQIELPAPEARPKLQHTVTLGQTNTPRDVPSPSSGEASGGSTVFSPTVVIQTGDPYGAMGQSFFSPGWGFGGWGFGGGFGGGFGLEDSRFDRGGRGQPRTPGRVTPPPGGDWQRPPDHGPSPMRTTAPGRNLR